VPQQAQDELDSYARGRDLFFRRAGPYDFSCASCHGADGQRIRLQELPNLTRPEGARSAFAYWPAYRVSHGAVRTMQWRLSDCVRQERLPELLFGSPASIDLTMYLGCWPAAQRWTRRRCAGKDQGMRANRVAQSMALVMVACSAGTRWGGRRRDGPGGP